MTLLNWQLIHEVTIALYLIAVKHSLPGLICSRSSGSITSTSTPLLFDWLNTSKRCTRCSIFHVCANSGFRSLSVCDLRGGRKDFKSLFKKFMCDFMMMLGWPLFLKLQNLKLSIRTQIRKSVQKKARSLDSDIQISLKEGN